MGIDECVDTDGACPFLDGFQQRLRICRQPAVNHERAVFAAHGNDVAAGALKQGEPSPKIRGGDFERVLKRGDPDGPGCSGSAGNLQELPA
jgi:hypothetical protein